MTTFTIPTIPYELQWRNVPLAWTVEPTGSLSITAGKRTDWFIDPQGTPAKSNAPVALFSPAEAEFMLPARVQVDFGSIFDAGVLMLHAGDDLWAKLCFELSPQGQPMIVSVVTRGLSDDCNSVPIEANQVYLRVSRLKQAFAFHYSTDGRSWPLVRYFALGQESGLKVGFSAQSPTGERCRAIFSEIDYRPERLNDIRSGQ